MLRNAEGVGGVYGSAQICVTKGLQSSVISTTRGWGGGVGVGWGGVSNFLIKNVM